MTSEMDESSSQEEMRELRLLEALADEPESRQVDLAARLGMAVGTLNWLIKRLTAKGYVKVKRIGQWRWRYLLTPRGVTAKARLTTAYLHESMRLYRQTREEARTLLADLHREGYASVRLEGDPHNDLIDVCRLTCLEQGISAVDGSSAKTSDVPVLRLAGRKISLEWPRETRDD